MIREKDDHCIALETQLENLQLKIYEIQFSNEQKHVQLQILNDQIQHEKEYNFHQEISKLLF